MAGYRHQRGERRKHESRLQRRLTALGAALDAAENDRDRATAAFDFFRGALHRSTSSQSVEQAVDAAVNVLTVLGTRLLTERPAKPRTTASGSDAA